MTKKTTIISIIALLAIIAVIIAFISQKEKPTVGEIGAWEANLQTLKFRPKLIGETEYGSSSGIRLTWEKPTQTYNHFLVVIKNPEIGFERKESGEHERTSLDVTDLKPDTSYAFSVQACFDPKCTSWITSNEKPIVSTDRQILRLVEQVDELEFIFLDEMKDVDVEKAIILTQDDKPWTENRNEWKATEVFLYKKPFAYFVKLVNQTSNKTLWVEFLNP